MIMFRYNMDTHYIHTLHTSVQLLVYANVSSASQPAQVFGNLACRGRKKERKKEREFLHVKINREAVDNIR